MSSRLHWPVLAATSLGLALALWVIGSVGFAAIAQGGARLGIGGFLLLLSCSIGVLGLLGAALLAATPGEPIRRLPTFIWSRITREGASDLLPFSQFGGLVVGAKTLTDSGLAPPRVYAAMIGDLTTELISQLLITLFGLWAVGSVLLHSTAAPSLWPLIWSGFGATVAITLAFALLQRPALRLAGLLLTRLLPGVQVAIEAVLGEIARFYRSPGAVSATFLLNLLAWIASAACAWLPLALMGETISLSQVIALESLIFALRSAAFVVPGALGLQEAGYALLGPLFGLDPATAVTLSLIKRARDISIGLPALILWQVAALRSGLRAPASE
jgi:putative membrane protein